MALTYFSNEDKIRKGSTSYYSPPEGWQLLKKNRVFLFLLPVLLVDAPVKAEVCEINLVNETADSDRMWRLVVGHVADGVGLCLRLGWAYGEGGFDMIHCDPDDAVIADGGPELDTCMISGDPSDPNNWLGDCCSDSCSGGYTNCELAM